MKIDCHARPCVSVCIEREIARVDDRTIGQCIHRQTGDVHDSGERWGERERARAYHPNDQLYRTRPIPVWFVFSCSLFSIFSSVSSRFVLCLGVLFPLGALVVCQLRSAYIHLLPQQNRTILYFYLHTRHPTDESNKRRCGLILGKSSVVCRADTKNGHCLDTSKKNCPSLLKERAERERKGHSSR